MEKKRNDTHPHTGPGDEAWPGYTLAELQFRREVNSVRQEIVAERLMSAVYGLKESGPMKAASGILSNFNGIISAVNYGMLAYRMFVKVRNLFRRKGA